MLFFPGMTEHRTERPWCSGLIFGDREGTLESLVAGGKTDHTHGLESRWLLLPPLLMVLPALSLIVNTVKYS